MSMLSATGAADTGLPAARRRLRLGMVGGGLASLIGETHRMAARLDDRYELVAGSFSADPARGRATGASLLIPPDRV
ncbi:MAG TPA: hypothetical protein VFE11_17230, partial [Dongiaceae bacterium]|nr:hypothetical protein [Dongiaceae bacterium]